MTHAWDKALDKNLASFLFQFNFKCDKIKPKKKQKCYGPWLGRGRPFTLWGTCLDHENLAPFGKKTFLINVDFMHFPKKWPTSTRHKSSESPLTNFFGLISK